MSTSIRAALGLAALLLASTFPASMAVAQNETDFFFATAMPTIEGELESVQEATNAQTGLAVRKSVYRIEHEAFDLRTHVIDAACGPLASDVRPHIVATQVFPRAPKSFRVAAMPDVFLEVYVRDDAGRIRVYEQLAAGALAALTARFEPPCRRL